MDYTQQNLERPWDELNQDKEILAKDIIERIKRSAPKAFAHQFEFLQYTLGRDVKDQAPIIALKSQTGSGKTLCFQTIIYQNYKPEVHSKIDYMDKSGKRVLTPYALVLGNTIFLKQHEEKFQESLPQRLKDQGLKFQTFFALTKDSQFQTLENKIEEAQAQVLLCHPSKIMAALKMRIMNFQNLRYLIIDEADQLLDASNPNSQRIREDCVNIIAYILGQKQKKEQSSFQLVFVSASLKQDDIESVMSDAIMKNFETEKPIDERFVKVSGSSKEAKIDIEVIPSTSSLSIAPYSIRHFYLQPKERKQRKALLADLIAKVFNKFDMIQIMVFFNSRVSSDKIFKNLVERQELEFLVKKDQCVICTGLTNQNDREQIRKDFKDKKKTILFCTDVLQRGLDFRGVKLIIHYGLPRNQAGDFVEEVYYQRSGRTGRAKDEGAVLVLLGQKDLQKRKKQMEETLTQKGSKIQEFNEQLFFEDLEKVLQNDLK